MTSDLAKHANLEVTLKMTSSVHHDAEVYSEKEGVSFDHFVDVAVAENLASLQHQEWLQKRMPMTDERRARALALLDRIGDGEVQPGDELPEGYVPPK